MLPIHRIIWHEWRATGVPVRVPEPEAMTDPEQIRSYVKAYEWGGPTSALQLYHLRCLSKLIKPGDTVLDLACGPGPLLLELARLYPDVHFVGADLSLPMLEALRSQAAAEQLVNVETLCEDIRTLPSIGAGSVDVVISTSALHHLPDDDSLLQALARARHVLNPGGRVYIFDFGLLKARETRALMVAEVARLAPPLTAADYAMSLDAAFPIQLVFKHARQVFGDSVERYSSSWVEFFYFLRSPPVPHCLEPGVASRLNDFRRGLSLAAVQELFLLSKMQRRAD